MLGNLHISWLIIMQDGYYWTAQMAESIQRCRLSRLILVPAMAGGSGSP